MTVHREQSVTVNREQSVTVHREQSVTVHREQSVKREETNKMQQLDVCYQLLSQHVSGIIMPIFRRIKTVCYCYGVLRWFGAV